MNDDQQTGLVHSTASALASCGLQALALRGHKDLLRMEEAREWYRKGMELHNTAFEDPGWKQLVEAQTRSQADRHAQFRVVIEFLRLVKEGVEPETAANDLEMSQDDRETAATLSNFWPDTAASMIRAVQQERERERAHRLRHEQRLRRAYLCFDAGCQLDSANSDIHFALSEYYSVGLGVERNEDRSLHHLRRSASLGHRGARRVLSYRFSASRAQEPAPTWFPHAAEYYRQSAGRSAGAY